MPPPRFTMPAARLLAAIAAVPLLAAFAACGDDGAPPTVKNASVSPTAVATSNDTKTAPKLPPPASKYSLLFEDIGTGYLTDVPNTYTLTIDNYSKTPTWANEGEGRQLLQKWGYQGGFETGYVPEGRLDSVLNGAFYITLELHLFSDEDGAKQAYAYFENKLKGSAAQAVQGPGVGNQSSIWRRLTGAKVGTSNVDAVLHTIIFRRGNLLAVVVTQGAAPLMKIDSALEVARIIDQKALGQVPAIEPTPVSNFKTPTPEPRASTTPSPTAGR